MSPVLVHLVTPSFPFLSPFTPSPLLLLHIPSFPSSSLSLSPLPTSLPYHLPSHLPFSFPAGSGVMETRGMTRELLSSWVTLLVYRDTTLLNHLGRRKEGERGERGRSGERGERVGGERRRKRKRRGGGGGGRYGD